MRSPTCLRVGNLLARRAAGLSESERLVIEDHLAACADCDDQARWLGSIVVLAQGATASVSASTRDRIVRRAVAAAGGAAESQAPPPRTLRRTMLGFALAGAAAGILWMATRPGSHTATSAADVDHIEAGHLRAGDDMLSSGNAVPGQQRLVATTGTRLELAHALVTTDHAEIVWYAEGTRLALAGGRVRVAVDATAGRAFSVETPAFLVEVVGTDFEVDLHGVRVWSGVVRVVAPDGAVLVATLVAGQSWSLPSQPAHPLDRPARDVDVPAHADPPDEQHPAPPRRTAAAPSSPARSADEWLARARDHLAAHRTSEARRAVTAALDARPTRREQAEARTLLAECAQAEGNHARAARLYRVVAEGFPDLPAGDNALFAAARAEARAGRAAEARALYRAYLERYPTGRFAREVKRQLHRPGDP